MIAGFINVTMSSLYAISAFVVIFGLLNMINMLINSAIIRKREFALLQAVGMTNRQLRKMLYREGMSVSIKSALLAAAFGITIAKPDVIFADEPTGNLDSKSGGEVMELLQGVWKKMGKALVVITHDIRIARMADRQFQIVDGILSEVTAR